MLSEHLLQLLSCSNSKIHFRTHSNYIAPEEDHRPSERVASSRIVGRRPVGTVSNSESEDDDTDDGAEGFSQDSAPAMTSSQLSSSSASATSALAPSAASRRPEVVEETSADVLSTPSGRKPSTGKWCRKGPSKEASMGGGTNSSLPLSIIWSARRKNCRLHQSCDPHEKSFMDEDELFCMSLVGTFKRLPAQKKELAKIRVQSLLYELQYGSPQPAPLSTLLQHAPMMALQNFQQHQPQHQPGPCIPNKGGEFTNLLNPLQGPQGEGGMAFSQQPSYGF